MKQLEADIKNGIYKNIYILTGVQTFLRKQAEKKLIADLLPEGDTMNLAQFNGKKTDIKEVIELARTMPFLSEHRVIILEETGLFSSSCEELAEFIPNIPESSCLIFSEDKIDNRLKQTKEVRSVGTVAEFANMNDADMRKWVMGRIGREHRPINERALDLFLERCGTDLWEVSNELEKLISYTFGKEGIRVEDVETICPPPPEDKIFKMIDAILAGDPRRALVFYTDLLALKSDPMGILKLLREQLRLLLHVKGLDSEHMDYKEAAKLLGMKDSRVKMALPAARKSSKISLTQKMAMCAETDERIKNGQVDAQIGVETLILELARHGSK